MSGRVDISRSVLAPWQLPDLDADSEQRLPPEFAEMTIGEADALGAAATFEIMGGLRRGAEKAPAAAPPQPEQNEGYGDGFERGRREGLEQGYAEGFRAGRQAGEASLADEAQRLRTIGQRLGEPMRILERPTEEAVIALALELARWVIGSEVSRSRDYLVRLVREAIARVPIDVGTPSIVLNPADIESIRALAPDFESHGIALVADESLEIGGCRVVASESGDNRIPDRRWHPGALQGVCEVDLTLASRWREAMFAMFEGEDN